jgi:hypothetical protein
MNGGSRNKFGTHDNARGFEHGMGRVILAAGVCVALAGTAFAQTGSNNGFDKPLKTRSTALGPASANSEHEAESVSYTRVHESNDGDTWEMTISGGTTTVKRNDEVIPNDRIRQKAGKVEVLGDDGTVIKTFKTTVTTVRVPRPPRAPQGMNWSAPPVPPVPASPPPAVAQTWSRSLDTPPPVMIGITMSDADEGVELDRVVEGLPAAIAGLETGDVLIKIDGKGPVTQTTLREVLRTRKPGDEVKVLVKRDEEEKEFTIKLAEYKAEKLSFYPGDYASTINDADSADAWESARDSLQAALEQLSSNAALQSGKLQADAVKALAEAKEHMAAALKELQSAHESGGLDIRSLVGRYTVGNRVRGSAGGQVFTFPAQGNADHDLPKQLEKLSEQLSSLNERLDRLEKKLDK